MNYCGAPDACEYPNGLAFSPDESILYVAISRLDERCFEEEERGDGISTCTRPWSEWTTGSLRASSPA